MSMSSRMTGGLLDLAQWARAKIKRGSTMEPAQGNDNTDPFSSSSLTDFSVLELSKESRPVSRVLSIPGHPEALQANENQFFRLSNTDTLETNDITRTRYYPVKEIRQLTIYISAPRVSGEPSEANRVSVAFDEDYEELPLMLAFDDQESRERFTEILRVMNPSIVVPPPVGVAWIADSARSSCMGCNSEFSMVNRKHHCRLDGGLYCAACSNHVAVLPDLGYNKPVRVCRSCFNSIKDQRLQSLAQSGLPLPLALASPGSPHDDAAGPSLLVGQTNSEGPITTHTVTAVRAPLASPISVCDPADGLTSEAHERQIVQAIKATIIPPTAGDAAPATASDPSAQSATPAPAASARDRFGFLSPTGDSSSSTLPPTLSTPAPAWQYAKQRDRWNEFLAVHPIIDQHTPGLKKLVRRGIPAELRGTVWPIISGSRERQINAPVNYYRDLLTSVSAAMAQTEENADPRSIDCRKAAMEIDKDLHRTFPDNVLYESEAGLALLRRVLLAFSYHNPHVAYCQSMNFIAGLCLLFMDEEEAFWLLATIIEKYLAVTDIQTTHTHAHSHTHSHGHNNTSTSGPTPGHDAAFKSFSFSDGSPALFYHQHDLAGAHIDERVFGELLAEKLPRLAAHFERLQMPLAPIIINWFLCLFVNSLPLDTLLNVWDCLMTEGPKMLFRTGLALIKLNEKAILRCSDFEELMRVVKCFSIQSLDEFQFTAMCFDPLWIGSFKWTRIAQLRLKYRPIIEAEFRVRNERKNERMNKRIQQEKERKQREQEEEKEKLKAEGREPSEGGVGEASPSSFVAIPDFHAQLSATSAPIEATGPASPTINTIVSPASPTSSSSSSSCFSPAARAAAAATGPVSPAHGFVSSGPSILSATVPSWELRAALHLTDQQRQATMNGDTKQTMGVKHEQARSKEQNRSPSPPSLPVPTNPPTTSAPAPVSSSPPFMAPHSLSALEPRFASRFQFFSALTHSQRFIKAPLDEEAQGVEARGEGEYIIVSKKDKQPTDLVNQVKAITGNSLATPAPSSSSTGGLHPPASPAPRGSASGVSSLIAKFQAQAVDNKNTEK